MVKTYVPLEKRTKKQRREYYARQRNDWNGVTPVTKVIPDKKKPDRLKEKARLRLEFS